MWVITALLLAVSFALALSFFEPKQETVQDRLRRVVAERKSLEGFESRDLPGTPLAPPAEEEARPRLTMREKVVGAVERATSGSRLTDRLALRLQRADWRWKPAEFLVAQLFCALAGFGLATVLIPALIWLLPVVGWAVPMLLLGRAEQIRLKQFELQLPDALAIIANAIRSGFSLLQAMDVVSREMPNPIAKEFGLILRETRVNIPLEESLGSLVRRVKSDDLDLMVTAILIQRQVGGNLSEVLDKIGGTIKERIRMQGEIRTLTTQGRVSGWVVSLLPLVLALLFQVVSPGYLNPMFSHPLGWVMIGAGLTMQFIGIMIIRNMINMEV